MRISASAAMVSGFEARREISIAQLRATTTR